MALKRCPYCKSIIEEDSEYCSNCGTQLLFPEDEFKEEEIPGDKIVEEEAEEAEDQAEEEAEPEREAFPPEEEEGALEVKEQEAEEEFLPETAEREAERREEIGEAAEAEEPGEAAYPEDQAGEPERPEPKEAPVPEAGDTGPEKDFFAERENEEAEKPSGVKKKKLGTVKPFFPPDIETVEVEEKAETPPLKEEPRPETEEKKRYADSEEKEMEEIEKFLQSIKKDRAGKSRTTEQISSPLDEKKTAELGEKLPPWAEKMKEELKIGAPEPQRREEEETGEEHVEPEVEHPEPEVQQPAPDEEILEPEEERPADQEELPEPEEPFREIAEKVPEEERPASGSGIGLPEDVAQESLPFGKAVERERIRPRRGLRFSLKAKSRAFDILFIAAFWMISFWLASRVMEVSLLRLISASVLPALGYYVVLLGGYFSLFLYFLGETLGDHLFPQEE